MSAQLKLEFFAGSDIVDACAEAIRIANMLRVVVVFDFNGVTVMAKPGACPKELAENAQHMLDSSLSVRIAVAHPSESGGAFHRNRRRSMADTDRELLELAAKAAGIEFDPEASKPTKNGHFFGLWLVIHCEPYEGQRRRWNPLTDDGDALRLAVKLRMRLQVTDFGAAARIGDDFEKSKLVATDEAVDVFAATRRAIVRAAAEIGKGMA